MAFQCTAMVFAHPGHELAVAGLLQRYRPHLLFLTRADSAGDLEREKLALHGLDQLGLAAQSTFLNVSEIDIYRWLLESALAPFLDLRDRIFQWLKEVRPTTLFGDAFELSNVIHDIGRALLDSAWREYGGGHACQNFELPLVCRTEPGLWNLRFQQFPFGDFETFHLTKAEAQTKQSLVDWAGARRTEAAEVKGFFSIEREVFRRVPDDRDYRFPPKGLRLHYDEWGRMKVEQGQHARPILFAEHYVPIVRELPALQRDTSVQAAASSG
jgi:hypothetical protein